MMSSLIRCLFISKPDVVIATSPQFFCGWAGVLLKWWFCLSRPFSKRSQFVLEIRDIWPESIQAVGAMKSGMAIRILEKMELWMYAAADHIVTVGQGYQNRLEEKGVPADKISIVMNGVDKEVLESSPSPEELAELRKQWRLEGKFVCSYIGTIGMASGLDIYLRAARLLRDAGRDDICLLAVGDGAVRTEVEAVAQEDGLENIIFTGRRPKQEMPLFLAASNVCFVHLRKTPLFESVIPSKIFEAMGMRRPILIGVGGEARKLVEESGGGMAIEPEDEQALVDFLVKYSEAPEELETLGEAGRRYVEAHFDRDQLAESYLKTLRSLVEVGSVSSGFTQSQNHGMTD